MAVPYNTPAQSQAMALLANKYPGTGYQMEQDGWAGLDRPRRREAARLWQDRYGVLFRDFRVVDVDPYQ